MHTLIHTLTNLPLRLQTRDGQGIKTLTVFLIQGLKMDHCALQKTLLEGVSPISTPQKRIMIIIMHMLTLANFILSQALESPQRSSLKNVYAQPPSWIKPICISTVES